MCNILITGAGSGLGRGLAVHFAQLGHTVIVTDRARESCEETIRLMGPSGKTSRAFALDVTSDTSLSAVMQTFGEYPIDVLINNAGVQHVAKLEEFPADKWDQLINILVSGPARMTRAVLPGMRARQFGRIINIGSIHSLVASPGKSAYVAAKHALLGFSKSIALETANTDITINTICPSYIRTPLVDGQIAQQARLNNLTEEEVIQRIFLDPMPKKAFITTEEVAAAAEYLMSPLARNITGQTITIDGGWTAR